MSATTKAALWLLLIIGLAVCWVIVQPRPEAQASPVERTAQTARAAVELDDNDPLGLPISHDRQLQVLHRAHFTIGYDNERREPAWASYHLSGPIRFHGHEHRRARFTPDPEVKQPAQHEDYTGSGYDRGHMVPAYAMWSRYGDDAVRDSFLTSNIVPQAHAMNAGVWEAIEELIAGREGEGGGWAETYGDVWVTDGPVHRDGEATIPGGESVPSACWMVVLRRDGAGWTSLAFEVPNEAEPRTPQRFLVAIADVERDAEIDLDAALPTDNQNALESVPPKPLWPH